jgi:HD superfamily phosphodiesterase
MNLKLLKALKSKASEILESNTRLHDYGHAIEVLGNVQKLIKASGNKLDIDILYTAALFHDVSNKQGGQAEDQEAAEIAGKVLGQISEFPTLQQPQIGRR